MDKALEDKKLTTDELLAFTADIVVSYVGNNSVTLDELPNLIKQVFATMHEIQAPMDEQIIRQEPAIAIKKSIQPDHIVCLEDGKHLKMLKRHLMTHYNLTPEEYRERWGLPHDYPMVAPNYAQQRRDLAKKIGLGKSRRSASA